MSTNAKNRIRPEFLKNFTSKIKRRYIIIQNGKISGNDLQQLLNSVNSTVNQIIQQLNLKIKDRQIPYTTLIAQINPTLDSRSRFVLHDDSSDGNFEMGIKTQSTLIGEDLSHLVEFLVAAGYKEIVISSLDCDAEIVVDYKFLECAIVDVLLDITVFNSYSFLKNLSIKEKHEFGCQKYTYFKECSFDCFYECKSNKELYYSFAFSARDSCDCFDVDKYIEIWNGFISKNYPNCTHKEKTISQQLKQHVDYEELPDNLQYRFNKRPKGAYLVLRTNKDRTEKLSPFIQSVFGIKEYEKGKIKIVPIEDFDKYKPLFENLDISAFKVVKP